MQPSPTERETRMQTLADALGSLQHVFMQLEQTRVLTIETHGAFLNRVARDEFSTYQHHFNNSITALNSVLQGLSLDTAPNDPDVAQILQDTRDELRERIIDEANAEPYRDTGMRGFAATAAPLAQEIKNKMHYLKGDDRAIAHELIGELQGVCDMTKKLDTALENAITAIEQVPTATVAAGQETQRQPIFPESSLLR